jgi:hypothetical protein
MFEFKTQSLPQYDLPTAVTFLIAGLGMGSLLALLLAPRAQSRRRTVPQTPAATYPMSAL